MKNDNLGLSHNSIILFTEKSNKSWLKPNITKWHSSTIDENRKVAHDQTGSYVLL